MGLGILICCLATSFLFIQSTVAADNASSPICPPFTDDLCEAIECGKGTCKAFSNFTFMCECNPGWRRYYTDDDFRFLPCVIPNCSLNWECNNASAPSLAPPTPNHTNQSIFDPCLWSYCGEGTCVRTSKFGHRCDCRESHTNLFNITSFPCFSECAIGADCVKLGVGLSNRSSSSTPSLSDRTVNKACSGPPRNLIWSIIFIISLATVPFM